MRTIIDPSPEDIFQAISDLIPVKYHFVILEAKPPVNDCRYIQTRIDDAGDSEIVYWLEASFDDHEKSYKQYRSYIIDVIQLKKTFQLFALEIAPDVTGWEDVTAEAKRSGEK